MNRRRGKIRHYNKTPKTVKWRYFDPTRRITPTSFVTVHQDLSQRAARLANGPFLLEDWAVADRAYARIPPPAVFAANRGEVPASTLASGRRNLRR